VAGLVALWTAILAITGAGPIGLALPAVAAAVLVVAARAHDWRRPRVSFPVPDRPSVRRAVARASHHAARAAHAIRRRATALRGPTDADRLRGQLRELNRAASEHRHAGRAEAAVVCCEHALAMAIATGDRRDEALTLNSLGLALAQRGDADRSEECLRRAAKILAELDELDLGAKVRANVVNLHARREDGGSAG